MSKMVAPENAHDGDYDHPTAAEVERFKSLGLSDYGTEMHISTFIGDNGNIDFHCYVDHFMDEAYSANFADLLDELVEGHKPWRGPPTDAVLEMIEAAVTSELAQMRARWLYRRQMWDATHRPRPDKTTATSEASTLPNTQKEGT